MNRLAAYVQSFWAVVVVNILLNGVVPNLFSDFVRTRLNLYSVVGTTVVLVVLWMAMRRMRSFRGIRVAVGAAPVRPRRGLVVLVSPGPPTIPAEEAIKVHLPSLERCWLIVGPGEGAGSPKENAERIVATYGGWNGRQIHFEIRNLQNPDNPAEVYYLVNSIYTESRAYGLRESDLIADYTGGTKSMTAGMVLACATREDRDVQYMRARRLTPQGTADRAGGADPVLVDLQFYHQLG
jgi:hypothetical protein